MTFAQRNPWDRLQCLFWPFMSGLKMLRWLRWHLSKRFSSRIIWNSNTVLLKSQSLIISLRTSKSSLKQTPCFPASITAGMPVLSACLSKHLLLYIYVMLFVSSIKKIPHSFRPKLHDVHSDILHKKKKNVTIREPLPRRLFSQCH